MILGSLNDSHSHSNLVFIDYCCINVLDDGTMVGVHVQNCTASYWQFLFTWMSHMTDWY